MFEEDKRESKQICKIKKERGSRGSKQCLGKTSSRLSVSAREKKSSNWRNLLLIVKVVSVCVQCVPLQFESKWSETGWVGMFESKLHMMFQCRTLKNKAERVSLTLQHWGQESLLTRYFFPFGMSQLETWEQHEAVEETHRTTQLWAHTTNRLSLSSFTFFFKRMRLSFWQLFPRTPDSQEPRGPMSTASSIVFRSFELHICAS